MIKLQQRNGRLDGAITFTEMDPVTWRQIEKLLKKHSDEKKMRKRLAETKNSERFDV